MLTYSCYMQLIVLKKLPLLFNLHLYCFVDFNNKRVRLIYLMWSKLKINTAWHSAGYFIAVFDHNQHYQHSVSTFNFEQVFVSRLWKASHNFLKTQKEIYLFCNKSCTTYFIQWFIISPNWNKLWTNDQTMNISWT